MDNDDIALGTEIRGSEIGETGWKAGVRLRWIECQDCHQRRWWPVKRISPDKCGPCSKTAYRFTFRPREQH